MPRRLSLVCTGLVLALSACAHPAQVVVHTPSGPGAAERLSAADALVLAGCLDCLTDAYREYDALRASPEAAGAATAGAVRAAALIVLRERELGMVDEGYLDRARAAAATIAAVQSTYAVVLDIVDSSVGRMTARDPDSTRRVQTMMANRSSWLDLLRAHADDDPLWAAAWVWFSCSNNPNRAEREPDALFAPLVRFKDAPIARYQAAVCAPNAEKLDGLLAANPRFHEVDYWLGVIAVASVGRGGSMSLLDAAQEQLARAAEWHPAWPAAMMALAGLYMTDEDFQPALDLFDRTLALVPDYGDAMVGRVRALSYLGRAADAVVEATALLQTPYFPGEAYYWRAWNELRLDRVEDAWLDIEQAERVWINFEVSKLAGIIAYQRHELDVAKTKFEAAQTMSPGDCETMFNLAAVNIELKSWSVAADGYATAGECLERSRDQASAELAALRQSTDRPARVARQIARHELEIATATRMLVQSWFNGAVADSNLGRTEEARRLAGKVGDDEQFGERAKALLTRLQ